MKFTGVRLTFAVPIVIAFFLAFLSQSCTHIPTPMHAHCDSWSPEGKKLVSVCKTYDYARGYCTEWGTKSVSYKDCLHWECDDGYVHDDKMNCVSSGETRAKEERAINDKDSTKLTLSDSSDVRSVSFSPDGKTIASGSGDKSVKLWDVASGKLKATLTGHSSSVTSVAFSPDGKTIASGSIDKSVKLWDVTIVR